MYDLVTKEIPEVLKAANLGLVRLASMSESTIADLVCRTGRGCPSSVTPWRCVCRRKMFGQC